MTGATHVHSRRATAATRPGAGPPGRPGRPLLLGASNQVLQTKLRVGAATDPLEHEADQVADAVSGAGVPPIGNTPPAVRAKCAECEAEEKTIRRAPGKDEDDEKTIRTKAGPGGPTAGGAAQAALAVAGGGVPLPAPARAYFEPRFGCDFSAVRIHTHERAQSAAAAINARAYTLGHDIAFAAGEYRPAGADGRLLIAHELAHVAQQAGSTVPAAASGLGSPDDRAEHEADTAAARASAGQQVGSLARDGTRLRRQSARKLKPRMDVARRLAIVNDPTSTHELGSLLAGNRVDGTPSIAIGPFQAADGTTHEWRLTVALNPNLGANGQTRGRTDDPVVSTRRTTGQNTTTVTVHTIAVSINPTLASSAEEQTAFPDLQTRMDQMAGATLLHELVHVRIKMRGAGAAAPASEVVDDFDKLKSNVAKAATERAAVETATQILLAIAANVVGRPVLSAARQPGFLKETIDHLVEEKFAKQTAGHAFGLSASVANAEIADAYSGQIERTIRGMAPLMNTLSSSEPFNQQTQAVKAAITTFFNKLDTLALAGRPAAAPKGDFPLRTLPEGTEYA